MEKVRNYAADTVPIMGRRCFKAMDNSAIEAAIGFQMGNIDDINLRDRNKRYLADQTTEINLKLPIPDGKSTMRMGWYNVYSKNNVVIRTSLLIEMEYVNEATDPGVKVTHFKFKLYKFYRIMNTDPALLYNEWEYLCPPTFYLLNATSATQYATFLDTGPSRKYNAMAISRSLDRMVKEIQTYINCAATYLVEIEFGKSGSIGELVPGKSSFANTRNQKMSMTDKKNWTLFG